MGRWYSRRTDASMSSASSSTGSMNRRASAIEAVTDDDDRHLAHRES